MKKTPEIHEKTMPSQPERIKKAKKVIRLFRIRAMQKMVTLSPEYSEKI